MKRIPDRAGRPVRVRTVVAGLAGVAVVAGVLAPGAVGAAEPAPSATPSASASASASASPSASASASPSAVPSASARPVVTRLPAPRAVSPLDGHAAKNVLLDWTPVAGADGYVVEVGTDDSWSDAKGSKNGLAGISSFDVTSGATSLTLPDSLPHGSYVWRVAATAAGVQGRWSANGAFERAWGAAPTPIFPSAGSISTSVRTFSWAPVLGASEYQVQISTSPLFLGGLTEDEAPTTTQAAPITVSCFTTRTELTPHVSHGDATVGGAGDCDLTKLYSASTVRYWRVRGLDHYVSEKVKLPTEPTVDEGISHLPPVFIGNKLDVTVCPAVAPSPTPVFTAPSPSASPSASASAAPAPSPSPTEDAGLLSCEPHNTVEKGSWSATTAFQMSWTGSSVDARALPAIDSETIRLSSPTCTAAKVCRDFPKLSWPAVVGASAYRVYVALDAGYSNITYLADVLGTEWLPYVSLRDNTAGRAYYYAVQACSDTGCGPVGAPASLVKRSPAVVPTGPAEGAELGADVDQVVLTWKEWSDTLAEVTGAPATSGPQAYRVQVTTQDDPDFTDPVLDADVDESSFISPTVRFPDGRLLWRVQAIDASDNLLPFSPVQSFVRDATAPTATLLDTAPLAVDGTVVLRFSEPVTGVDASSIKVEPATAVTVRLAPDRLSAVLSPSPRWLLGAKHTVSLAPTVQDLVGNSVVPAAGDLEVVSRADDSSPALGYVGRWNPRVSTNALGGGYRATTPTMRAQSAATTYLFGNGTRITGCYGPTGGLADVWVDGVKRARVDTYRSYSGCGVTLAEYALPLGRHQVQVRGIGMKRSTSKGTTIMLDAVDALH